MRHLAAFLVVAGVAAQLATAQHELTTLHVTCAEHGEIVDAPIAQQGHADESFRAADPAHDQKGHEHCVLAVHARHHAASPAPHAFAGAAAVAAAPPPPPVTTAPHAVFELLRLAPKTSPPV